MSENINSSNHKIHSNDKMRKAILNFGSKKGKKNDNSSCQLTCLHSALLMSILTPQKSIYLMFIGI